MLWKDLRQKVPLGKLQLPLYQVLVVPLVLQVIAAGTIAAWLSLQYGEESVRSVSSQLRTELAARINLQLKDYLEKPQLINQVNVNAAKLGQINLQDNLALERFFTAQLSLFSSVSQVYLGRPDGTIVLAERQANVTFSRTTDTLTKLSVYELNNNGDRQRLITVKDNFDVRSRPWYRTALERRQPIWSPPYTFQEKGELGITAAYPFYDRDGKLLGIMSTDLMLEHISDFLKKLKIGETGQAFIIETSGFLVASSTGEHVYKGDKTQLERTQAGDSQNLLTRRTFNFLQNKFAGRLAELREPQQLDFIDSDGKRQFVKVLPYSDAQGLNWLIVVVLPEADFMGPINANARATTLLCMLALVLSIIVAIITSRWIARPVLRLKEASSAIASGQLNQKVNIEPISELAAMATSFNKMARQLRKAFSDLEESNAYLNSILSNLTSGLIVVDLSDLISCVNPTFLKMFEIEGEDIISKDYRDVVSTEVANLIKQIQQNPEDEVIAEVNLANHRVGQAVVTAIYKDISVCVLGTSLYTYSQQQDDEIDCLGYAVSIRDITLEKEIDQLKNEFLSNISHELRTPLVSILGFTKVIDKKFNEVIVPAVENNEDRKVQKCVKQVKENLSIVLHETDKLTTIIANVLDIANLEANRVIFNMQLLDIGEVVNQSVESTKALFTAKQLPLVINIADNLPQIIGDHNRLIQVVEHLLTNAVNFTDTGSIGCKVVQHEQELIISVTDTGIGIATQNQDKIFEKFKQVGDILTDKPHGTGLGLPICKAIVQAHGGRLWLESELNRGSTFFVSLPITAVMKQEAVGS